jgi:hypothetical protein
MRNRNLLRSFHSTATLLLFEVFLLLGISILGYGVYRAIPSLRLAVSVATARFSWSKVP